jgi:hypothetical protein
LKFNRAIARISNADIQTALRIERRKKAQRQEGSPGGETEGSA